MATFDGIDAEAYEDWLRPILTKDGSPATAAAFAGLLAECARWHGVAAERERTIEMLLTMLETTRQQRETPR